MALTKAEEKELEALRERAETAEKAVEDVTKENETLVASNEQVNVANEKLLTANNNLSTSNETLVKDNDDANVKIAQAAIDQQNAVDEAVEAKEAEMMEQVEAAKGGRVDKSVSPEKPLPFDRGAYYSECHGDDVSFAQNGWFYNHEGKPVRPVNKPKKK